MRDLGFAYPAHLSKLLPCRCPMAVHGNPARQNHPGLSPNPQNGPAAFAICRGESADCRSQVGEIAAYLGRLRLKVSFNNGSEIVVRDSMETEAIRNKRLQFH